VLILSALGDVDDRITGLRAGGDDYLTKPYHMAELLARIDALAAARHGQRGSQHQIEIGGPGTRPDDPARHAQRQEDRVDAREFQLLEFMMRHSGQS